MTISKKTIDKKRKREVQDLVAKKLLGTLEAEIMECMWDLEQATVPQCVKVITANRPLAYTTVMTVMTHLVEKGLLIRNIDGKRYLYTVALSKEEFLLASSRDTVRRVLNDFGDLAIAGFMGEISKGDRSKLHEIKALLEEALNEESSSL